MHRKSLRTAVAALTVGFALLGGAATAAAEPYSPAPVADSGSGGIIVLTLAGLLRELGLATGSIEPCDYTEFPSNCAY
ncbi:hypothetical protein BOX37_24600 [Nocardia mangyaensis]|uniref:Uncharacterized protein n=1 Tax=Nocardia mangyaensis TaxID=2213200 RepID=A0A1J0VX43_9NOCA|nr:hypothetical protein [Nocardia mangyaensis]APE36578.1 hypothetical protein BOX37_24600 [Nocardia mangyaensis]